MNKSIDSTFDFDHGYTVDNRRYFSDLDLKNVDVMADYQEYLKNGEYTEAADCINNSDAFNFGAWYFNMLVNRLKASTYYLQNVMDPRPEWTRYQSAEPIDVESNTTWITDSDDFGYLYKIGIAPGIANGTVSVSTSNPQAGETVNLYFNADLGYTLSYYYIVPYSIMPDEPLTLRDFPDLHAKVMEEAETPLYMPWVPFSDGEPVVFSLITGGHALISYRTYDETGTEEKGKDTLEIGDGSQGYSFYNPTGSVDTIADYERGEALLHVYYYDSDPYSGESSDKYDGLLAVNWPIHPNANGDSFIMPACSVVISACFTETSNTENRVTLSEFAVSGSISNEVYIDVAGYNKTINSAIYSDSMPTELEVGTIWIGGDDE